MGNQSVDVKTTGAAHIVLNPDGTSDLHLIFVGFPSPGYAASFAEIVQLLLEQNPPKLLDMGLPPGCEIIRQF